MKPFDKRDKEQVKTWNVVVREKEQIVRVYCPTCWDKAKKLIDEINLNE
jgi:ribosomal protein L15E